MGSRGRYSLCPRRPGCADRDDNGGTDLKETLVHRERQSWEAWKNRDGKFFQDFLSDDHVEIGFNGISKEAAVVAGVGSPACVVKSYSVDHFELTVFDPSSALLTYYADQDTTCGGNPVPSSVWVSSLYVKRGGRWWNAAYQQTQTKRRTSVASDAPAPTGSSASGFTR
ncbi:MAG TPA: nuclear transport factor 2 family protein [Thermoanaerobaculia bacterium]